MGYTTEKHIWFGTITNFWPDNTEPPLYFSADNNLQYIMDEAQKKWPGITPDQLTIGAEYIHTSCLYHDLSDAGDYTNFIVITHN